MYSKNMKILSLQNYKDKEIHPQSKHMLLTHFSS